MLGGEFSSLGKHESNEQMPLTLSVFVFPFFFFSAQDETESQFKFDGSNSSRNPSLPIKLDRKDKEKLVSFLFFLSLFRTV